MKQLSFLLLFVVLAGYGLQAAPAISGITANAQSDNVLRYDVSFTTDADAIGYVEYYYMAGPADTVRAYTNYTASGTTHNLTIRGLIQQTTYRYRVAAFNATGINYSTWASFTTAMLPFGLPEIISVDQPDTSGTEGYIFTTSIRFNALLEQTAQIFDRQGNLVWYQTFDDLAIPSKYDECKFAHYLGGTRMAFTGCNDIWEVDLDGSVKNTVTFTGADTNFLFHHDVLVNRNGNYVAIAAEPITFDFSGTGGPSDSLVISESVLEIDPDNGNILFEWQASDDYNTTTFLELVPGNFWLPGFPTSYSWLHANGLTEDLDRGIIVSFRKTNEVVKLNPNNGDIVWKLGGPNSTYSLPTSNRFSAQHTPTVTGGNRYMIFDNTSLAVDTLTRVTEFLLVNYDQSTIKTWEYILPRNNFTPLAGSAYNLKNGKILTGSAITGRVMLVDSASRTRQFEMVQSEPMYRAIHVDGLYDMPSFDNCGIAPVDTVTYYCVSDTTGRGFGIWNCTNSGVDFNGGYYSGPGIVDGMFVPAVAGIGTHTITYHYGRSEFPLQVTVDADSVFLCATGIRQLAAKELAVNLYPNPSNGLLNIEVDALQGVATFAISGLNGQQLMTGVIESAKQTVDISAIPAGVYMLQVQNETGLATKKLVVY